MADRTVKYTFTANILGLTAGLTAAGRSVADLGTKLTAADTKGAKMRAGLTSLGGTAGKVGLVAAAGFTVAVAAAAHFESAMSRAGAATNATAGEMDDLRAAALKAGADTVFSASEAADGITELGKAGLSTADILGGALTGALNLAAAGQISVAEASETTAITLQQFGLAGDQASHVADVLAASSGKAIGSVSDMSAALKYVGPVAAQMGISLEESAGAIAELASQGVIGEQAGTSLRGMLTSLTSPSKMATDQMEALGISLYDAQGQFVGLEGVAGQLQASMGDLSAAERDQALGRIFGNEQITAARILYAGGASEVQKWTAAVDDSGYAAEQAAKLTDNLAGDVEQLRGSLETAFIGSGSGSQGPLRQLVQGATDAVNVFNKMPGPIQNTTTALLGITAVTGGSLWFGGKVVGGISDTRKALKDLGVESTRVNAALKGLGVAAGVGTALMVTSAAIEEIESHSRNAVPGVEALTKSLIGLGNAQAAQQLQEQLGDIGEAMAALDDPGFWGKLDKFADGVPLGLGNLSHWASPVISLGISNADDAADEATASLNALDQALANVVATGSAETARKTFDDLAAAYGLTDEQQKALLSHLPAYQEALDGAANSATLAAGATADLGVAARQAATTSDDAMAKLRTQFEDTRDAARDTAKTFVNLGDSLNDPKKSLGEWLHSLEQQAEALRNFRINAQDAAEKGLDDGLIKSLQEAGPEGALRMKQLANATDAEIKRANRAWRSGQDEVNKYARSIAGIPPEATTAVEAKTFDAMTAIARLKVALTNIDDEDVNVRIHYLNIGNKLAGMAAVGAAGADGMTVPGPRTPYGDKVLSFLAPGEEVITNRNGEADRFRADRASGRIPAYADGGTVGGRSLDSRLEIVGLLQQLRDLRRELDARIKKGKNKGEFEIQGLDRKRALLELEAAERDLRRAKNAEEREARQELRDQQREQRGTRSDLSAGMGGMFDSLLPGPELTTAQQVAATIRDFREQWLAAGGKWSADLREWAQNARAAAAEYDRVSLAIDAESRHRDELTATLSEQQSAYNELTSTMKSFGDSVAANFLTDAFGRTVSVAGSAGPASAQLAALQVALTAAQAAGDAAKASRLMQQMALVREQADAETAQRDLTGVEALRETLARDTQNSQDFTAALQTLADKGLDTSGAFGGLYAGLAQSGDPLTAQQMADLTAQQIDELEKAYKARDDAAASTAAQVVQEKYGADQAVQLAALTQTQAAVNQSVAAIELMQATLPLIAEQVKSGAEASGALIQTDVQAVSTDVQAVKTAVEALPRELRALIRQSGDK